MENEPDKTEKRVAAQEKAAKPTTKPNTPAKPAKKHKKTPLIITIIVLAILLIGGGVFAAIAIVRNQPENIARDAMQNFFNAKYITTTGTVNLTSSSSSYYGIKSVGIDFNVKTANSDHSTDTTIRIGLEDGSEITLLSIGEIMIGGGNFYLKLSGVKKTYEDIFKTYLVQSLGRSVYANKITTSIDNLIEYIEGRWFEIAIDDILNDEMFSGIAASTSQNVSTEYECISNKLSNAQSYSDEFSKLYDQYPFVVLKSGQDSFYDVTFDPQKLADYANSVSKTNFYSDVISCTDSSTVVAPATISSDDAAKALEYFPAISAKFDGFLSHHLTELKITKDYAGYNFASDLKFNYSDTTNVSAPSDTTPIMELVYKIYNFAEELY